MTRANRLKRWKADHWLLLAWALSFAAGAYAQTATPASSALVFNPAPVGGVTASSAQQLTASFMVTGYTGSFTPTAVLHYGHDYVPGALTCTPSGSSGTSETCTLPVSFVPTLPGARKDAVLLMNGSTHLATVLLGGIGQAPYSAIQPGVVTQPTAVFNTIAVQGNSYVYDSIVDDNGTVYIVAQQDASIYSYAKDGTVTKLPITGLTQPHGIAIDGAGTLYIGINDYSHTIVTYTSDGVVGSITVPATGSCTNPDYPLAVATDIAGNVYDMDDECQAVIEIKTDGTSTLTPLNPAITQPSYLTVDANSNVFIGGYQINEITSGGTQTQVNTNGTEGLVVDASGTLYAGRNNGVAISELAPTNYSVTAYGSLDHTSAQTGLGIGPDTTVYAGNYSNLDVIDRSQGVIAFGSQDPGTTSAPETINVLNIGNQPLSLSGYAIAGPGFAVSAPTTTCTTTTTLAPAASCNIAVTDTIPHAGSFTGTLTVTTNSLNTPTPQTVNLSSFQYGVYASTATTALSFGNQTVNTTSATQTITFNVSADLYTASFSFNTGSSDFAATGISCTAVPDGGSCTANVTFKPAAAQAYSATLSVIVSSSGGGSYQTITIPLSGTGTPATAPSAGLTPSTYAFPSTVQSTSSAPSAFTLSNTGTGPLLISGISLSSGTNFAETNNCPASLAAGASCQISVTFTPSSTGAFTASLIVADNNATPQQTVSLSGTGIAGTPTASLTPATLSFPSTLVSSSAATQAVTLTNTGTAALSVSGVTITGASASSFSQTNNCPPSLAVNASCTAVVTFTPNTTGALSAALSFADNATGSPQTVTLNGTGIAPQAVFSTGMLAFGNQISGTTSAAQTVTLSNPGTAQLTIGNITLSGANPGAFAITNNCGASLAVSASCTVSVTFTPASVASFSAALSAADNAANTPQSITLTGTGTAPPVPGAVLSPTALTFASTTLGSTPAVQTITLSNPGTASLTITGITIGGANASSFAETSTCGGSLAVEASCTISVTFAPTATGTSSATLSVADNAAGSPQSVALTGSGMGSTDFILTASPATQAIAAGGTATYALNLAAVSGVFTGPVNLTITGLPSGFTTTFAPSSLPGGTSTASSTLTIQAPQTLARLIQQDFSHGVLFALGLPLLLLPFRRRSRHLLYRRGIRTWIFLLILSAAAAVSFTGCGGGFPESPSTFTITITAASPTNTHATTVNLSVQ